MKKYRFATFNTSLFRNTQGQLIWDLQQAQNTQIKYIAEIIQRVAPDILVLQEFDYDENQQALTLFQKHYLTVASSQTSALHYPYQHAFASNTGIASGFDLDGDGKTSSAGDALGYGTFAGQYAFAILSRYPLDLAHCRTFQHFLWKDMPNARIPSYYSKEIQAILPLSSKNHVDLPVQLPEGDIHCLISHPTPPIPHASGYDVNIHRNYDEIRFWQDYLANAAYFYDDQGKTGGLAQDTYCCILGDLNADPQRYPAASHSIQHLLAHPRLHARTTLGTLTPSQLASPLRGRYHTTSWQARVDYVLPSQQLNPRMSGIFWQATNQALSYLFKQDISSDHRLVWVDIAFN